MAHLDLPMRLNLGTHSQWEKYEQQAVHALSGTKTPLEVNTALYCKQNIPHPMPRIMDMVYNANVPVLLSDDAHHTEHICRYFDVAQQYMAQHHISKFCELEKHILHTR